MQQGRGQDVKGVGVVLVFGQSTGNKVCVVMPHDSQEQSAPELQVR
jgi:hypothetical protein